MPDPGRFFGAFRAAKRLGARSEPARMRANKNLTPHDRVDRRVCRRTAVSPVGAGPDAETRLLSGRFGLPTPWQPFRWPHARARRCRVAALRRTLSAEGISDVETSNNGSMRSLRVSPSSPRIITNESSTLEERVANLDANGEF